VLSHKTKASLLKIWYQDSDSDIRAGGQIALDRVWTEFFGVEAFNGKIM